MHAELQVLSTFDGTSTSARTVIEDLFGRFAAYIVQGRRVFFVGLVLLVSCPGELLQRCELLVVPSCVQEPAHASFMGKSKAYTCFIRFVCVCVFAYHDKHKQKQIKLSSRPSQAQPPREVMLAGKLIISLKLYASD